MAKKFFYQAITNPPWVEELFENPIVPQQSFEGEAEIPIRSKQLGKLLPVFTTFVLDADLFDVTPAPLIPWYQPLPEPPRRTIQQAIYAEFQNRPLDDSTFETPPDNPEQLSWWVPTLDQRRGPRRHPEQVRFEEFVIPESGFGTVDYHPGYWYTRWMELPQKKRRQALFDENAWGALPESTFDPLPIVPDPWDALQRPIPIEAATWHPNSHLLWFSDVSVPVDFGADALRTYLTGAASDGAAQADQSSSLGNFRSSTEAKHVGLLVDHAIRDFTINAASRANGAEGQAGSIVKVTDDSIRYTAPGSSTPGPEVQLFSTDTRTIPDGENPSKFVRVTRDSATAILGLGVIELVDQFNNVFGLDDADNTESTLGDDRYRGVMLRNDSQQTCELIYLYVGTLGDSVVTTVHVLGGGGAGTIQGDQDGFCGWPHRGWCRIESAGGALKEIVYYSSRTDDVLTVPSFGRALLGTTAQGGLLTDVAYPVPGIRIAYEAASPAANGSVQTIADETIAPLGVAWSTGITAAGGISVGTLLSQEQGAIWIHRQVPAGIDAFAKHQNHIGVQFDLEGTTYTETLTGLYRIAVNARRRLEAHVGVDSDPDLTATPDDTDAVAIGTTAEAHLTATPWTPSITLTNDAENRIAINFRNEYDLVSEVGLTGIILLDSGGTELAMPPTAPTDVTFTAAASGTFRATATYFLESDPTARQADTWHLYFTSDGTDPDPDNDSPTVIAMTHDGAVALLDYSSFGTFAADTVGKIVVRTHRLSDTTDSTNTTILTATAVTAGPSTPTGGAFYRGVAEEK